MADKKMYKVGITVKEPWSPDISYEVLDITLYAVESGGDGCSYTAIKPNQGVTPGTDDTVWVKSTQAGQSIYDLAVKYHHFVGTEEEFEQQYQDALAAANNAAAAASATDEEIKANELSRVSAENGRVAAEQSRVSAEQSRVSAESARVSAESARVSAESSRESAEATRASNESARVTAENSRVSAESARVTAEQSRLQQFEALKTDMNTAIANVDAKAAEIEEDIEGYEANEAARVTAEDSRVSAESSRVSAESARVTAENARVAQASSDHTRAETDHGTAASDHTTAQADHTQAGTDHTQAALDHTTAAADHTQAGTDHTASETATQAAIAAAEAATEAAGTIDEKIAEKADKDGYYGGMTVGAAENLVGRGTTDAEYAGVRTSAGTADIGSGSATIARMRGRSFKWNQLVRNGNFADGTTGWSFNRASGSVANNECTITTGTQPAATTLFTQTVSILGGHKYYIAFDFAGLVSEKLRVLAGGSYPMLPSLDYTSSTNTRVKGISTALSSQSSISFYPNSNNTSAASSDICKVKNIILIDLTQLFGAGNEPETVEEFDEWRKEMGLTLDYYAYNPGEVINNRAAAIETVGFNLYDYSTGKAFLPGVYSSYPHEYEICGTFTSISFRDVNGNESVPELTDGRFFNVPGPGELTVVGGNNTDTLVHLVWSGWRNEGEPDYTYEPYWKNTLNLGLTTLKGKLNGAGDSVVVFPNGLAKIGDVRDEIVGNKAIKRIGVVDLGTLDWVYQSSYTRFYSTSAILFNNRANAITAIYENANVGAGSFVGDKIFTLATFGGRPTVAVIDSAYSDAATFKTAMSGVLLYYELETPEEYTLDEPMPSQYRVDDFGTERVIPSYSPSELTAPIAYDVQYAMNAVDAIRRLDDNYVNESQVKQTAGRSETDVYSQKGVDDNYAKKVGLEENLVSGLSRNLAGKDVQTGEFSTAVISGADGLAKINEVMGKSLVWNQLCSTSFPQSRFQFNNTEGSSRQFRTSGITVNNIVAGHKFLFCTDFTIEENNSVTHNLTYLYSYQTSNGYLITNDLLRNAAGRYRRIFILSVGDTKATQSYFWTIEAGDYLDLTVNSVIAIDLTLMFGAGNEPTTVAEFESWLANNIGYRDYYAYNAGEIISNNTEALEITGLNQWDEEIEIGSINASTGYNVSASNRWRSKNYISVLPNTNYYFCNTLASGSNVIYVFAYDADKNYIGCYANGEWRKNGTIGYINNRILATPPSCCYIRIQNYSGDTYQNNICINISGSRDGEYEPYQKSELELNLATITGKLNGEGESVTIFPDGMRSAGTAYDSLIVDEDGWCRRAIKRVGGVDMGTLTWVYDTNNVFRVDNFRQAAWSANLLCVPYSANSAGASGANLPDKGISITNSTAYKILRIKDTSYSDASAFKSAMQGVLLYYELATPLEYVLDTPIQMTFQAKHGGVIRQLPENGSEPTTAPMRMSVTYALDAVSILTDLPENYISKESLQAMLSAMQSAGLFSAYTMTFNESTGKYEFTFTANA